LYLVLVLLVLIRIIPYLYPASRTWGFNHLIFLLPVYSIAYFAIAAIALILPFIKKSEVWSDGFIDWFNFTFFESPRRYWYRLLFIVPIAILFMAYPMTTYFLGDGYEVLNNIASDADTFFKWSESGVILLLKTFRRLLGGDRTQSAVVAIHIVSYLSGIFSIWFYFGIAQYLSSQKYKRLLIFSASLFSGALLLFFGYAEHYPSLWIALTGTIFGGLKYIRTGKGLMIMWLFLIFGVAMHLQMTILIPGAIYLTLFAGDNTGRKSKSFKNLLWIIVLLAIGFVGIFAYKYLTDLFFQIMFLKILPGGSDYTVFSISHLLDVTNEALLISPLLFLFILLIGKNEIMGSRKEKLIFLALISFASLLFLFIVDPKLGMPRDWDLLSTTLFAVTILSIILIREDFGQDVKKMMMTILILLGIFPMPYLFTNLNHATSAKYSEYYCSLDLNRSSVSLLILYTYYEDHGNIEKLDELKNIYEANFTRRKKFDSVLTAMNAGDLNSAIDILGRIEPNQYDVNYQRVLGRLYYMQGDLDKAMTHIENTIQLSRYNSDYYGDRSKVYMALGESDKALDDLRHGFSLNNSSKYVIDGLTNTFFALNDFDSTIYYAEKRLAIDPSKPDFYYMLARSYFAKGDIPKAKHYAGEFAKFNLKNSKYQTQVKDLIELFSRSVS